MLYLGIRSAHPEVKHASTHFAGRGAGYAALDALASLRARESSCLSCSSCSSYSSCSSCFRLATRGFAALTSFRRLCRREKSLFDTLVGTFVETSEGGFALPCGSIILTHREAELTTFLRVAQNPG